MAQLGKMEFTVLDEDGQPAEGVTLTIRKQGAQVRGTSGASPYTVDDIGAVSTGATVALYVTSTKTETSTASATINSGTSIGTTPNLGAANDDDRITVTSPAPSVFEDALSGTSISNILTTDTEGRAECYAAAGFYDVKRSGGGVTDRLYTDVACYGAKSTAHMFDSGSAVGFEDNIVNAATGSTFASAAKIRRFMHAGTEKASIDKDGDFTGTDVHVANIDTSGAVVVGTNATVGGTLGVTGTTTVAAVTASGLITGSAGISISAGSVSVPAASVAVAALAAGITESTYATQGAIMALSTTPTTITSCSVSTNIAATSSVVLLMGQCAFINTGGAARTVTLGIYEDGVLLGTATDTEIGASPAADVSTIPIFTIRTGISGAKTYTLRASQNTGTDVNAIANTGRIFALELNK